MQLIVKWMKYKNWMDFDVSSILHMGRDHAINLFSGKIPVIIRQDEQYFTNDDSILAQYQRKGHKIKLISSLEPVSKPICNVGLI